MQKQGLYDFQAEKVVGIVLPELLARIVLVSKKKCGHSAISIWDNRALAIFDSIAGTGPRRHFPPGRIIGVSPASDSASELVDGGCIQYRIVRVRRVVPVRILSALACRVFFNIPGESFEEMDQLLASLLSCAEAQSGHVAGEPRRDPAQVRGKNSPRDVVGLMRHDLRTTILWNQSDIPPRGGRSWQEIQGTEEQQASEAAP